MKLKEPLLFRQQAYIDGAWCNADSGATFGVDNPATGEIIGNVPDMGAAETQRAVRTDNLSPRALVARAPVAAEQPPHGVARHAQARGTRVGCIGRRPWQHPVSRL